MYIHEYVAHVHEHVASSCSAQTGKHEACMCECCPIWILQQILLKAKDIHELYVCSNTKLVTSTA